MDNQHPQAVRVARERGSSMLLVPIAVLGLMTLAGIAVDSAMVFAGMREAADAAAAAANDAAASFDQDDFYADGSIDAYAADNAGAQAQRALNARNFTLLKGATVAASFPSSNGQPTVKMQVSGTVNTFFFKAVPGLRNSFSVSVGGTAELRESN
jgi:hypothetical protein